MPARTNEQGERMRIGVRQGFRNALTCNRHKHLASGIAPAGTQPSIYEQQDGLYISACGKLTEYLLGLPILSAIDEKNSVLNPVRIFALPLHFSECKQKFIVIFANRPFQNH